MQRPKSKGGILMLFPSIFDDSFSDGFFDDMFRSPFHYNQNGKVNAMHSDIKEFPTSYQIDMELPGYSKEEISADLKDGYMTIRASHSENKEEKDSNGKYIRKERFTGSCQRSFYVGTDVTESDIKAKFENGILSLEVPKKDALPQKEDVKTISIL